MVEHMDFVGVHDLSCFLATSNTLKCKLQQSRRSGFVPNQFSSWYYPYYYLFISCFFDKIWFFVDFCGNLEAVSSRIDY